MPCSSCGHENPGEGQNVVVLGEAGVGKSRLVYQLHEHLAAVPHTWLECGATPYTEGTPFHPIIALVEHGLAFAPEDTATEKLGKLEAGLRSLASSENVSLLADFLGLPPPMRLHFSPELQRRKTIDLLAQWNLAMSEVQPLAVFVEDLHWCDVSTLELLGHLIAQSPTARVLLLATARPEFTPPWPARSNLTTVQLARLTKRQARDMIATLAGTELPTAILDALVARADGVPLYIEELTKAVTEPGAARRHQPGAALAAPGQARKGPRPPRPALRLVHRRLRHARPANREVAARRLGVEGRLLHRRLPLRRRPVRLRVVSCARAIRRAVA